MDFGSFFAESGTTFLWLFVAIAAAIVESMTCDLVAVWFVPGALSAMLLSVFVSSLWRCRCWSWCCRKRCLKNTCRKASRPR